MAQNELQLVTFEQAKRLKAAGFDWNTNKYYDHEFYFEAPFDNHNNSQCFFSAPTVALNAMLKPNSLLTFLSSKITFYFFIQQKFLINAFCIEQKKHKHLIYDYFTTL